MLPRWLHLSGLLWRSWLFLVSALGTTTLAVIVGIVATLGPTLMAFLIDARRVGARDAITKWRRSFKLGIPVTLALWLILSAWAIMETVYQDHVAMTTMTVRLRQDVAAKGQELAAADDDRLTLRARIKELESERKPPHQPAPAPAPPPEIRAISNATGRVENGLVVTEIILIPNVAISPPVVIELNFDHPIYFLGVSPRPMPGALLGGGERWDGTRGFATLPNLGISPNLLWVVTIKSRQVVTLVSAPRLRTGF